MYYPLCNVIPPQLFPSFQHIFLANFKAEYLSGLPVAQPAKYTPSLLCTHLSFGAHLYLNDVSWDGDFLKIRPALNPHLPFQIVIPPQDAPSLVHLALADSNLEYWMALPVAHPDK